MVLERVPERRQTLTLRARRRCRTSGRNRDPRTDTRPARRTSLRYPRTERRELSRVRVRFRQRRRLHAASRRARSTGLPRRRARRRSASNATRISGIVSAKRRARARSSCEAIHSELTITRRWFPDKRVARIPSRSRSSTIRCTEMSGAFANRASSRGYVSRSATAMTTTRVRVGLPKSFSPSILRA